MSIFLQFLLAFQQSFASLGFHSNDSASLSRCCVLQHRFKVGYAITESRSPSQLVPCRIEINWRFLLIGWTSFSSGWLRRTLKCQRKMKECQVQCSSNGVVFSPNWKRQQRLEGSFTCRSKLISLKTFFFFLFCLLFILFYLFFFYVFVGLDYCEQPVRRDSFQSSFRAVPGQFQSVFSVKFPSAWLEYIGAISEHFQSGFSAILKRFQSWILKRPVLVLQSNFRAVSELLRGSFSALSALNSKIPGLTASEQFQSTLRAISERF